MSDLSFQQPATGRWAPRPPRRRRSALAGAAVVVLASAGLVTVTPTAAVAEPLDGVAYVVTSTADGNDGTCDAHCTLREAVALANSTPERDTVTFALPADRPFIGLASPVAISQPLVVDGGTAPGCSGLPGAAVYSEQSAVGLQVTASDTVIRGLKVNGFATGISLLRGARNRLECNAIYNNSNGTGVQVASSEDNVIGSLDPSRRNVFWNNSTSVLIQYAGSVRNQVVGNYIGTPDGTEVGNGGSGVVVVEAGAGNVVGGGDPGARNVISGLRGDGVLVHSSSATVQGNYIGTDGSGTRALGNGTGVSLIGATTGTTVVGNVISGNGDRGITVTGVQGTVAGATIQGNLIGTTASGDAVLGNVNDGVHINDATGVVLGGGAPGQGNVIAGNRMGVWLTNAGATGNVVRGNAIGTDLGGTLDLGNRWEGLRVQGASANLLGGAAPGEGNLIARNRGAGIVAYGPGSAGNEISGNGIWGNGDLGIDLVPTGVTPDGVTANDSADADTGANGLQNHPVLTSARIDGSETTVTVGLSAAARQTYRIEVFASDDCDRSGFGEGRQHLGSVELTTDDDGSASIAGRFLVVRSPSQWLTATATGMSTGDTSEFGPCVATETVGSSTPAEGGTVSTGSEATTEAPLASAVTVPPGTAGGEISIAPSPTVTSLPQGTYGLIGLEVHISAPDATWDNPLLLRFVLDQTSVPADQTADTIAVYRNGTALPDCLGSTAALPPSQDAPAGSACVADRQTLPGGDVSLAVNTPGASFWAFSGTDTRKPTITLRTPPDGQQYAVGTSVVASYSCADPGGSGIATCSGTTASGAALDLSTVGTRSFTVTATDRAGNAHTVTHTYRVVYPFTASSAALSNFPTFNVVRAGQIVPLRFSLGGNRGSDIFAAGHPQVTQVACGRPTVRVRETLSAGHPSLSYDSTTGLYTWAFATSSSWTRTCQRLNIRTADGVDHLALFKF